jgi:release factor glutamine methyltransferase
MRLEEHLRAAARRLAGSDTPHLDLRLLACHVLGLGEADIIAQSARELSQEEMAALDRLLARRMAGESVAHIIGRKEFFGLDFELAPGVLSPRPDTEILIEAAARRRDGAAPLRILDLGTGSGAILAAALTRFPNAHGLGLDLNETAARLARRNLERLGLAERAQVLVGDWGEAVSRRFDVVLSNPPYIAEGERLSLPPEVRDFEDPRALFGGADGLGAFRRLFEGGPRLLAREGLMILEFGLGQGPTLQSLARQAFAAADIAIENDLAGRPRALLIDLRPQKNI